MAYTEHKDPEVDKALIRLDDALCSWERATGIESVLILREKGGFVHRSVSGKSNVPDDITDKSLISNILYPQGVPDRFGEFSDNILID